MLSWFLLVYLISSKYLCFSVSPSYVSFLKISRKPRHTQEHFISTNLTKNLKILRAQWFVSNCIAISLLNDIFLKSLLLSRFPFPSFNRKNCVTSSPSWGSERVKKKSFRLTCKLKFFQTSVTLTRARSRAENHEVQVVRPRPLSGTLLDQEGKVQAQEERSTINQD